MTVLPQITPLLRTAPPSASRASGTPVAATPVGRPDSDHTPAAAATPRYYTIRPGDTLEHIADRFDVSIASLQEANDGHLSEPLIPGYVLLIPPSMSASPTGTFARILLTNTPLPLALPAPICHDTPADETICLGWVAPPLSVTLMNVIVQVSLRGPSGEPVGQSTTPLNQTIIPPGTGAPYAARFRALPGGVSATAVLLSAEQVQPDRAPAAPLTVIESRTAPEGDAVHIWATFRHTGSTPLIDVLAVLTLFDGEDRVTGFRVLRVDGALAPGEVIRLDAQVTPLGSGTTRHQVYAEGRPVE